MLALYAGLSDCAKASIRYTLVRKMWQKMVDRDNRSHGLQHPLDHSGLHVRIGHAPAWAAPAQPWVWAACTRSCPHVRMCRFGPRACLGCTCCGPCMPAILDHVLLWVKSTCMCTYGFGSASGQIEMPNLAIYAYNILLLRMTNFILSLPLYRLY